MAYRNDLDALSARHDALSAELAQKTQEVADAARTLEEARTRAKLPVLDNIQVATPCHADWAQMTGDERSRHCGDCKKNVYNLSGMTRDEAQALIVEKEGNLCARYYQRHDGTILLADCSIGIGRRRKRRAVAAGVLAILGGAALFAFDRKQTCEGSDAIEMKYGVDHLPPDVQESVRLELPPLDFEYVTMGIVAMPDRTEQIKAIEEQLKSLEIEKQLLEGRDK